MKSTSLINKFSSVIMDPAAFNLPTCLHILTFINYLILVTICHIKHFHDDRVYRLHQEFSAYGY